MARIVLAHGILGYGDQDRFGVRIRSPYFNGVAAHYEKNPEHEVLVPTVPPLGPLEDRAAALAAAIDAHWPDQTGIVVIGHSMGGLDIRRAVARHKDTLAKRIRTIACVATPHKGSPLADAVLEKSHPLRPFIPPMLLNLLQHHTGAVDDLRTDRTPQDDDVEGIRYLEVGCDCTQAVRPSVLFELSQEIAGLPRVGNDGVVTLESARYKHRPLHATWPADHLDAVGWPTDGWGVLPLLQAFAGSPADHLRRYDALLAAALAP
ncbi:hypothetical protein LJR039_004907 [Pseudorhodoferax sp. LjRoot39]|uniref:esterase/lipase family protein n=1 Tax=Pseudorhodoferax sp. LjRoot39 TaxID=3342328 RepID=UPI003ECF5935